MDSREMYQHFEEIKEKLNELLNIFSQEEEQENIVKKDED